MRLIWAPPDGERREWEFVPQHLRTVEAELVEDVGGDRWDNLDKFRDLLFDRNRRALRAALWIVRRRDEPGLSFDGLDLRADEVGIDPWGETEKAWVRERMISGADDVADEVRQVWVAVLGEDPTAGDPKAGPSDSPQPPTG